MRILEIKNLYREETGLYYRRIFTGLVVVELPIKVVEAPVDFIIETGPMGNKNLDIDFKEKIDYPLIPILKAIKEFIVNLDQEGKLP